MTAEGIAEILKDRIQMLVSDHKTFLFIRTKDYHKKFGLGGGNLTSAIAAFSALNLLSKVNLYVDYPDKFETSEGIEKAVVVQKKIAKSIEKEKQLSDMLKKYYKKPRKFEVNETHAFSYLIKNLHTAGIDLGVDPNNSEAHRLIWNGFRNFLVHLGTVEGGKQIVTFEFKLEGKQPSLESRISKLERYNAFEHDGGGRNWRVFIDALFVKIDKRILPFVEQKLRDTDVSSSQIKGLEELIVGKND